MTFKIGTSKAVTVALIGLFCTVGCQTGHLSRSNAKAQLENIQQQNPDWPHTLLVSIGTVADCEPNPIQSGYDPVKDNASTQVLSATGYLTIRPIKKHVWDVHLTERGKQSLAGEQYGHEQKGDCNKWQVTIPLSKYDHLDVTGIVEDGVHAKVDASLTFIITPVGMAVRKVASDTIFKIDKQMFGQDLATKFLARNLETLLSNDLVYTPPDKDRYVKQASFEFAKYDDGWKPTGKDVK